MWTQAFPLNKIKLSYCSCQCTRQTYIWKKKQTWTAIESLKIQSVKLKVYGEHQQRASAFKSYATN